jgi:hypothetical protein
MERPDGRDAGQGQGQYGTHAETVADHAATPNQARSSDRAPHSPTAPAQLPEGHPSWGDPAVLGATHRGFRGERWVPEQAA